ncbi:hypothetical protein NECAME_01278 [Necator americanus]|uniref:Uncharacterized protein n=1 Tax=Necator americanus TaxID=51031 RepID=W2TZL3_NECAM|nr:hypothetical protein NECAME_01278 [Necator americanus]ETN87119.1 hypothetical protein NECAME_01278 [Necator americanus]
MTKRRNSTSMRGRRLRSGQLEVKQLISVNEEVLAAGQRREHSLSITKPVVDLWKLAINRKVDRFEMVLSHGAGDKIFSKATHIEDKMKVIVDVSFDVFVDL